MKTKKGQVNQLTGFAIALIVFTLVIVIGLNLTTSMRNTGQTVTTTSRVNDTFTALIGSAVDFAPSSLDYDNGGKEHLINCLSVVLYNYTEDVLTENFTVSDCTAELLSATYNNTEFGVDYSYTYNVYSTDYNATQTNISSIQSIIPWTPIIIIAFIGGVILFLVLRQIGN